MLAATDTGQLTCKNLDEDYLPARGCEFKEGEGSTNDRVKHLRQAESGVKRCEKEQPAHSVMQMFRAP